MHTLPEARLRRAVKPVFVLALIMSLAAGCGSPGGNPATLPTSTLPAPTEAPTMAATATEIASTPTATEIASTPTATDAPTETLTPAPLIPVVVNDTLCYGGPGKDYGVMSSLQAGTNVTLLGKGGRPGWWIVLNPTYNQPCWLAEADLNISPSYNTSALQVYPVPVIAANLVATRGSLDPSPPNCKQQFIISVTITNAGPGSSLIGGTILATDLRSSNGSTVTTASGTFPTLSPGQSYKAHFSMTVKKYWGEEHKLQITVNPSDQVVETTKSDNTVTIKYTLAQGSCT